MHCVRQVQKRSKATFAHSFIFEKSCDDPLEQSNASAQNPVPTESKIEHM